MQRIFEFYDSEYMTSMKPFKGALRSLVVLKKKYKLVVITARPNIIKDKTEAAIAKYFPDIFDSVYLTNGYSKTGIKKLKSEICQEIGVSLLVDDSEINAFDCAEKGIKIVLFRRPWNQSLSESKLINSSIYPANDWQEVLKVINKLNV